MLAPISELKVGDRVYLVHNDGIKTIEKKKTHWFFWKKSVKTEEDSYIELRSVVSSVADDGSKCLLKGVYVNGAGNVLSFESLFLLDKDTMQTWFDDENGGIVIKRVNDIIFEHNKEIITRK